MAEELIDGEFWLPSEFLTDDDILIDFNLSTATDEDDLCQFSTSPKSILFGCDSNQHGSNLGTPTVSISNKDDNATLDLLNKTVGEVVKMKIISEKTRTIGTGFFDCSNSGQRQLYPSQPPPTNPAQFPLQPFYYHPHFSRIKRSYNNNKSNNRPLGLPTIAWPPLLGQAQPQSQPKIGTGVFFPRPISSHADPKNKSGENANKTKNNKVENAKKTKNNKRSHQRNSHPAKANHEEIELPLEWVY